MTESRTRGGAAGRLPAIVLTETVFDRLDGLAQAAEHRLPEVAEYLERELDRAKVVADGRLPQGRATIGSTVVFEETANGQQHTAILCWPADEDSAAGRLSVMTPVGAALIGLGEGQSIKWQNRAGVWRTLRVLSVRPPAAEA